MNFSNIYCFWRFVLIVVALGLLAGCTGGKTTATNDKELFGLVKTGMTRAQVEKILGKPVHEVGNEVYYGKPPKIQKWQSPQTPASILVVYSTNNVVESMKFCEGTK